MIRIGDYKVDVYQGVVAIRDVSDDSFMEITIDTWEEIVEYVDKQKGRVQ